MTVSWEIVLTTILKFGLDDEPKERGRAWDCVSEGRLGKGSDALRERHGRTLRSWRVAPSNLAPGELGGRGSNAANKTHWHEGGSAPNPLLCILSGSMPISGRVVRSAVETKEGRTEGWCNPHNLAEVRSWWGFKGCHVTPPSNLPGLRLNQT